MDWAEELSLQREVVVEQKREDGHSKDWGLAGVVVKMTCQASRPLMAAGQVRPDPRGGQHHFGVVSELLEAEVWQY